MDRQRSVAPAANSAEKRIGDGIGRMRRERRGGMAQQPVDRGRRRGLQAEKFGERAVADRAARLHSERTLAIGHVAHGRHALAPHAGVGRLDRPPPLLLVEPSALRAHTPRERGEPAARGNRTAQAGQFQMTVGVDHPRQQDAGVELHASLPVGIAPRIDADDRTVVSERQQRPGPQSRASQQVVRRDPARGGGYRNHRRKS